MARQVPVSFFAVTVRVVAVGVVGPPQLSLPRSRTGRLIRAVAAARGAAQRGGPTYRHIFGIAAAIAMGTVALAGVSYGMLTEFAPTSGVATLLFAFESVVIGGIGSLWGTLLGGIILGVAQQIGAQINPSYQILAGNLVFLAVLAVRPPGVLGVRPA